MEPPRYCSQCKDQRSGIADGLADGLADGSGAPCSALCMFCYNYLHDAPKPVWCGSVCTACGNGVEDSTEEEVRVGLQHIGHSKPREGDICKEHVREGTCAHCCELRSLTCCPHCAKNPSNGAICVCCGKMLHACAIPTYCCADCNCYKTDSSS